MSFDSTGTDEIEVCVVVKQTAGTLRVSFMQTHESVIENFIREGKGGTGTYIRATDDHLYSKIPEQYRPYGHEPWGEPLPARSRHLP